MVYPIQFDKLLALNIDNDYKIRCYTFDWEQAMILEPLIMEYIP